MTAPADHGGRHRRRSRRSIAEVAAEDYYAFDTEFHTERTYVPDLALIQIAWTDKVALVDPLAVDPAPLAAVFGGPGVAVAHAASQDLDVLLAACGAVPATVFDTQIVAGFLGMSTPSLSRLVDADARRGAPQGGPPLGLAGAADLGTPDRLRRQRRRPPPGAAGRPHRAPPRPGRLEWALSECDEVLGDRTPARVPEEAWWRAGGYPEHVTPLQRRRAGGGGLARAHGGRDQPAPSHGALGPRAARHFATTAPQRGRTAPRPRRGRPALGAGARGGDPPGRRRGIALAPEQIRMPSEGRESPAPPAAIAVCSGVARQIADDLDFDQGLLATRADIAQLLCGEPSRLDTGWRRTIVGDPLRRLIVGDAAAAFDERGRLVLEERSGRPVVPDQAPPD